MIKLSKIDAPPVAPPADDGSRLMRYGKWTAEGEFRVDPQLEPWLDALDDADGGDKSKLVALLKSRCPLPSRIIPDIGDLIDRWELVKPKGRPRIPSYRWTDSEFELNMANCLVDDLLASGDFSVSDAIEEAAAECGVKESVLCEYHAKRRGADRRAKARSYKHARK